MKGWREGGNTDGALRNKRQSAVLVVLQQQLPAEALIPARTSEKQGASSSPVHVSSRQLGDV